MGRYRISARAALSALLALGALTRAANATEPTPEDFDPRWLIDPGRLEVPAAEPDLVRFEAHGEYQIRLRGQSSIALPRYRSDVGTDELSQTIRLTHWLRFTPEIQLGDRLRIVGQADLAGGFFAGQPTQYVTAARDPYERQQPLRTEPRWLFVEYSHGHVDLRGGQQPSHWGLGLVENDGDHPVRWGDYQSGSRVERLEVRLHPAAEDPKFEARFAEDLVFVDAEADLRDDQRAVRALASLRAGREQGDAVGLLAIYRRQTEPQSSNGGATRAVTRHGTLDLTGQFAARVPGLSVWVYGGAEAALRRGDSSLAPTLAQPNGGRETLAGFGAVARLGAVLTRSAAAPSHGRAAAELEWGWTSGDADPYDGVDRRFALDPNHNVGLILFDEVLAWKTARAATIGQDPILGPRPLPEARALATNGSVVGASYLQPQILFRPTPPLDLRAGAVVAQTTADLVDPVAVYTTGRYANYDGGLPTSHDLGVEVMIGMDWRIQTDTGLTLQLGAQAATLLPGNAFADAHGNRMAAQHAGVARLGVQY